MDKLYVKFKRPKTLKEFFIKFFEGGEQNDRVISGTETYSDPECTIEQCSSYRNRSFSELLILAKTYYKSATHKNVLITLINLRLKDKSGRPCYFYLMYCGGVQKQVIIYYYQMCNNHISENICSDNMNAKSILKPLGLNNNISEIYTCKYYKQ